MTIKELLTRYSTWVVTLCMGVAAYWLRLSAEDQAKLMALYPWLKEAAPAAGLVAFLAARAAPQPPKDSQ